MNTQASIPMDVGQSIQLAELSVANEFEVGFYVTNPQIQKNAQNNSQKSAIIGGGVIDYSTASSHLAGEFCTITLKSKSVFGIVTAAIAPNGHAAVEINIG